MARLLKPKTYHIKSNLKGGAPSKSATNKYINATLKSLVRSGVGGERLDNFIKLAKDTQRILNRNPSRLSAKSKETISNLLRFNKDLPVYKNNNIYNPYRTLKYTKELKFNYQENISAKQMQQLKKMGLSNRDINLIKFRQDNPNNIKKDLTNLGKLVEGNDITFTIIEGMGGIRLAIKKYYEDTKRICNDYLGIDIDEWDTSD